MNYAALNANSSISSEDAELALLRKILGELSPNVKTRIVRKLEHERKAFQHSNDVGHLTWYEQKVAVCAAMERLS